MIINLQPGTVGMTVRPIVFRDFMQGRSLGILDVPEDYTASRLGMRRPFPCTVIAEVGGYHG